MNEYLGNVFSDEAQAEESNMAEFGFCIDKHTTVHVCYYDSHSEGCAYSDVCGSNHHTGNPHWKPMR